MNFLMCICVSVCLRKIQVRFNLLVNLNSGQRQPIVTSYHSKNRIIFFHNIRHELSCGFAFQYLFLSASAVFYIPFAVSCPGCQFLQRVRWAFYRSEARSFQCILQVRVCYGRRKGTKQCKARIPDRYIFWRISLLSRRQ